MLVIKDLHSDISDQFWLFYGYKYKNRKSMNKEYYVSEVEDKSSVEYSKKSSA